MRRVGAYSPTAAVSRYYCGADRQGAQRRMGEFFNELSRRKVFRVAALYIVGAWVVLQVADLAFPGLQVPEGSIRFVWIGAIAALPIVLILGWRFNIAGGRITRTPALDMTEAIPLGRSDYAILSVLAVGIVAIGLGVAAEVWKSRTSSPDAISPATVNAKSIAILPFENLSGDAANQPFTMGVHDDVLTHVSKISDIKVISRTSVVRLDRGISIREIGKLLDVATVLEGGVQRIGSRIRINAQLIDATTDQHLWAESFDRELSAENIFAIQSEIAAAITEKLRATLSPRDKANLNKLPTHNLQAYEAYLLGKQRMSHRTGPDFFAARDYFENAIEIDPEYALAYVGLAEVSLLLNTYGYWQLEESLDVAEPALEAALDLDDELGAVQTAVALKYTREGRIAEARAAYERAIALDPNYATPYHWLGDLLVNVLGEPEVAVPVLENARQLDPLSAIIAATLGEALEGVGRLDEALAHYRKAVEIDPDYPGGYAMLAAHYQAARGQLDEAVRAGRRELSLDPTRNSDVLGMMYLDLGDAETAAYWIERSVSTRPFSAFAVTAETLLHRYLGEEEEALDAAERLYEIAPGNNMSLVTLVTYGYYEEALESFLPFYSWLECDVDPTVVRNNLFPAINLSLAFEKTGNADCANRILDAVLEQMQRMPRLGVRGYGIADVEVYARQGKTRLALDALRKAIDEGYRWLWWAQGEGSPHMTSLLENAEFKAMMDEIRADMADQLERVRQMEANGELAVVPELP